IQNDDVQVGASTIQFSAADFTIAESGGSATVTLTRGGATDAPASVTFTAAAGTAQPDVDFTPATTVVTFGVGETTATVQVPASDNTAPDGSRTVNLALRTATGTNVRLGQPAQAALTITDNDQPPPPALTPTQCFVFQLYVDLLGRAPEARGLQSFTTAIDQGVVTRTQAALLIESTPEFRRRALDQLYLRLLDRPIDPAGENGWTAFLAGGGTLEQVEAAILGSPEYLTSQAGGTTRGFLDAVYTDVLGRAIDPAGLARW